MQFWAMTHKFKNVARPVLQGGKIVLEESRDTKSDSFFHTLCYQNQMDNAWAGKDGTFLCAAKAKVELKQNFRSLLIHKYKPTL